MTGDGDHMVNIAAIHQALQHKQYKVAEHKAIVWLRQESNSAQGWVFLGEALLHQGQGNAARAVFQRAALLDPQATWFDTIHNALSKVLPGPSRPDIERLLTSRKVSVAAAIITYNEERTIERCILSLIDAVDEIVVLDSASTDRTLDIVAQFPQVKVIKNVGLEDDFAGKRNKGLAHIDSDWVFWVDADEWLEEADQAAVREAAGLFDQASLPVVLNVCLLNYVGDRVVQELSFPRLFPMRRGLHFYGRVHEQVVGEDEDMFSNDIRRRPVRIRLHHDGYQPEVMQRKNKLERNLRLLQRMVTEDPANPTWWLYYGRETLTRGETEQALHFLLEAERKAEQEPRFGRVNEIQLLLIDIYFSRGAYDDAEAVCHRALQANKDFPDALYWLAQIRLRQATSLLKQAEMGLHQSKQAFNTYRGIVSPDHDIMTWKADAALANMAALTGRVEQAKRIYDAILTQNPHLDIVRKQLHKLPN